MNRKGPGAWAPKYMELTPFVKWAGGKRQLLDEISKRLPHKFNRYIEPFVGGGALFLALARQGSLINDINMSLINAYREIKDKPNELIERIIRLDDGIKTGRKEFYYEQRARYNDLIANKIFDTENAALFIFLNFSHHLDQK